jgi:hypothetical protein
MYILPLIMILNYFVWCDSIENGWKGIKPLKTDKASVDKLLGTPEIDTDGFQGYTKDNIYVRINYSSTPCINTYFGRGEYNIAKDTVLNYEVVIKRVMKISELEFNHEKYLKDTSGDLANFVSYIDSEDGIIITVYVQEGTEYVKTISFSPTKQDSETFKCSK